MTEFKKGDLITFKTHPYNNDNIRIKISAFPDYTSPILVIKEIKDKLFDKETGKDIGQQLNCYYYNSREGKLIEKWINSNLVNRIKSTIVNNKILSEFDFKKELSELNKDNCAKNYENLIKEKYLNSKVILKSVNVELEKVKINRTRENGDLIETNHLEFLPPVMVIIGFKFNDDKNKFDEKSGLALIDFKCKWYNSYSKSFSESYFSYESLYRVAEIQNLEVEHDLLSDITEAIEENSYINLVLNEKIILEESGEIISRTIGIPESVIFKHYFYQMNFFDLIKQKKSAVTIDKVFDKYSDTDIFGKKYPHYDKRGNSKAINFAYEKGSYYYITYKDMYDNITRRIIKIADLFIYIKRFFDFTERYPALKDWSPDEEPFLLDYGYDNNGKVYIFLDNGSLSAPLPRNVFEDKDAEFIIKANCLLRKGKIRNFKVKQILEVREIINGVDLFENAI